MQNKNIIKSNLKKHLINFGLKFFDSYREYDIWKENYLKKSNISIDEKKKYLKYLEKNLINRNYNLGNDFYDLIAKHRKLMLITHSMKSHDILNYGVSIINELKENSNVLDIGCNSGYLTSFYAKTFPNSNFIGLDRSKNSILQAMKMSNLKKHSNLYFYNNYDSLNKYKFNIMIDTQCFSTLNKQNLLIALDLLKGCLHSNIKIISISNLRNEEEANIFLKLFLKKNFFVHSMSPLFVESLDGVIAFTKIIFTTKKDESEYNLKEYFMNVRKKISIVNLFKLN